MANRNHSNGLALVHSAAPARIINTGRKAGSRPISFDRTELGTLLNLYGRKVSLGEWRDYAMDFLKDRALFSIYRRNSERPMFVVEKNPKLSRKQGQFLVTNQAGRVLKRGHNLTQVLKVLDASFVVIK